MPDFDQELSEAMSSFLKEAFPAKFDPGTWKKDKFQNYYVDNQQVQAVINDLTRRVAGNHGLVISDDDLKALDTFVTVSSSPNDVLGPMRNTILG